MKKIICTLWMAICALNVMAQENQVVNLQLETRIDYQREYLDGDAVKSNSGFKGKYLNVILNGTINAPRQSIYLNPLRGSPPSRPKMFTFLGFPKGK